jgi:hypothetical protein
MSILVLGALLLPIIPNFVNHLYNHVVRKRECGETGSRNCTNPMVHKKHRIVRTPFRSVRYNDHKNKPRIISHTELLFSVIPGVAENDNDLAHQRDPERHRRKWTMLESVPDVPQSEVGENLVLRDGWSGHDDDDGS